MFSLLTWSLSSWEFDSELILRRATRSEEQPWETRTGGWGARLFFGTSVRTEWEPTIDEFELGKAMLSGRGLLASTGEAGALTVIAFKEQTPNQNTIRGLFPNTQSASQPITNQSKQASLWTALPGQIFSCFFGICWRGLYFPLLFDFYLFLAWLLLQK